MNGPDNVPFGQRFLELLFAARKGTGGLSVEQVARIKTADRDGTIHILGKDRNALHTMALEILEEDRLIYKSRVQHGLSEAETHCDLDLRPYGLQFLEALAATGKGTAGLNDEQIAKLQSANRVETIQVLGKHRSAIHNLTMEVLDEEDPEQVRLKEFRRKLEGLGYVFWT
ncbi:MAG: hypothetical protein R3F33_01685 [Planctomycetota bacterium]